MAAPTRKRCGPAGDALELHGVNLVEVKISEKLIGSAGVEWSKSGVDRTCGSMGQLPLASGTM